LILKGPNGVHNPPGRAMQDLLHYKINRKYKAPMQREPIGPVGFMRLVRPVPPKPSLTREDGGWRARVRQPKVATAFRLPELWQLCVHLGEMIHRNGENINS